MKLYKLTDQGGNTRNGTNWIPETMHKKPPCDNPELCSAFVYHAYTNANLALLLNPIHANIDNPRLFECTGEIVVSSWDKVGCFSLTSRKEVYLPEWYTDTERRKKVRVLFAILCAESVLHVYEKYNPSDMHPQQTIEAAKECLKHPNNITSSAAYAAAKDTYATAYTVYPASAVDAAYAAAKAAEAAVDAAYPVEDAEDAKAAAEAAALAAAYAADAADAAAKDADTDINFAKLADLAVKITIGIDNEEIERAMIKLGLIDYEN